MDDGKLLAIKIVHRNNSERIPQYYYVDANTGVRLTAADLPNYKIFTSGVEKPWSPADGVEGEADETTKQPKPSTSNEIVDPELRDEGIYRSDSGAGEGGAGIRTGFNPDGGTTGGTINLGNLGYVGDTLAEKIVRAVVTGVAVLSPVPGLGIGVNMAINHHNKNQLRDAAARLGIDISQFERPGPLGIGTRMDKKAALAEIKRVAELQGIEDPFADVDTEDTQVETNAYNEVMSATSSQVANAKRELAAAGEDTNFQDLGVSMSTPAGRAVAADLTNFGVSTSDLAGQAVTPAGQFSDPRMNTIANSPESFDTSQAVSNPNSLTNLGLNAPREYSPSFSDIQGLEASVVGQAQSVSPRTRSIAWADPTTGEPVSSVDPNASVNQTTQPMDTFDPKNPVSVASFTGVPTATVNDNIGFVSNAQRTGYRASRVNPNKQAMVEQNVQKIGAVAKAVQDRFGENIHSLNSMVDLEQSGRYAGTQHRHEDNEMAVDIDTRGMSGPAKIGTIMAAADVGYNNFGISTFSGAMHLGVDAAPGLWAYTPNGVINAQKRPQAFAQEIANRVVPGTQTTFGAIKTYQDKRWSGGISRKDIVSLSPDFAASVEKIESSLPTPAPAPRSFAAPQDTVTDFDDPVTNHMERNLASVPGRVTSNNVSFVGVDPSTAQIGPELDTDMISPSGVDITNDQQFSPDPVGPTTTFSRDVANPALANGALPTPSRSPNGYASIAQSMSDTYGMPVSPEEVATFGDLVTNETFSHTSTPAQNAKRSYAVASAIVNRAVNVHQRTGTSTPLKDVMTAPRQFEAMDFMSVNKKGFTPKDTALKDLQAPSIKDVAMEVLSDPTKVQDVTHFAIDGEAAIAKDIAKAPNAVTDETKTVTGMGFPGDPFAGYTAKDRISDMGKGLIGGSRSFTDYGKGEMSFRDSINNSYRDGPLSFPDVTPNGLINNDGWSFDRLGEYGVGFTSDRNSINNSYRNSPLSFSSPVQNSGLLNNYGWGFDREGEFGKSFSTKGYSSSGPGSTYGGSTGIGATRGGSYGDGLRGGDGKSSTGGSSSSSQVGGSSGATRGGSFGDGTRGGDGVSNDRGGSSSSGQTGGSSGATRSGDAGDGSRGGSSSSSGQTGGSEGATRGGDDGDGTRG